MMGTRRVVAFLGSQSNSDTIRVQQNGHGRTVLSETFRGRLPAILMFLSFSSVIGVIFIVEGVSKFIDRVGIPMASLMIGFSLVVTVLGALYGFRKRTVIVDTTFGIVELRKGWINASVEQRKLSDLSDIRLVDIPFFRKGLPPVTICGLVVEWRGGGGQMLFVTSNRNKAEQIATDLLSAI